MILSLEHHVDWIADCIASLRSNGLDTIEARQEATEEWAEHTEMVANRTLFPKANSWYMGANVEGKPRMFMAYIGGFDNYIARCDAVAANGFEGFELSASKVEERA